MFTFEIPSEKYILSLPKHQTEAVTIQQRYLLLFIAGYLNVD